METDVKEGVGWGGGWCGYCEILSKRAGYECDLVAVKSAEDKN